MPISVLSGKLVSDIAINLIVPIQPLVCGGKIRILTLVKKEIKKSIFFIGWIEFCYTAILFSS